MKIISFFALLIGLQSIHASAEQTHNFTVMGGDFIARSGSVSWSETECDAASESSEVYNCKLVEGSVIKIDGIDFEIKANKLLKIISHLKGFAYENLYLTGEELQTNLTFTLQISRKEGTPLSGKLMTQMGQTWTVSFK